MTDKTKESSGSDSDSDNDGAGAIARLIMRMIHENRETFTICNTTFVLYVEQTYNGLDSDSTQYKQLYMAYMAGMMQFFSLTVEAAEHLTEDQVTELLDKLYQELQDSAELITADAGAHS